MALEKRASLELPLDRRISTLVIAVCKRSSGQAEFRPALLNMIKYIFAFKTRPEQWPRAGSPKRHNRKSIAETARSVQARTVSEAVAATPILTFALRSFILFSIDRCWGGGG